jgi:hypothetical protein
MASRFYLTAPISAILDNPRKGEPARVMLPVGAILQPTSQPSTTLAGMFGVHWEGRHYSVSLSELMLKADLVQTA